MEGHPAADVVALVVMDAADAAEATEGVRGTDDMVDSAEKNAFVADVGAGARMARVVEVELSRATD